MSQRTRFFLTGLLLAAAALALTARDASAQNLQKFVAKGTQINISADTAEKIAQSCLDYAAKNQLKISLSIVGPEGSVEYARSMDGDYPVNAQTAFMKAQTSMFFRGSTHQMENGLIGGAPAAPNQAQGAYQDFIHEMNIKGLHEYAVSGGLPIIVDDQYIGAIGVSGAGARDEEVANYGLTTVIGPQRPLAKVMPEPPRPATAPTKP